MNELSTPGAHATESKTSPNGGRNVAPTLIGGTGRTGKTRLAIALMGGSGPVAGFPLEGVFHVYHKRRFPFFSAQRQRIVREYVERPRYVDASRSEVERPSQYLDRDIVQLVTTLPAHFDHQVKLIGWTLDQFAIGHGRTTWAAFDLHPEFRYETYRRLIPGLRLAVMRRNPCATIAANLFWRSYPNPPADRRRRFLNSLFLLCLSNVATKSLEHRYPDSVTDFNFEALVAGDTDELLRLAHYFSTEPEPIRAALALEPHFSFDPARGFLGPDGAWASLLTPVEIKTITRAQKGHMPHPLLGPLVVLGRYAPNKARILAELYLYPGQTLRRQLNAMRQIVVDLRAGASARFFEKSGCDQDASPPFFVVSGCHGVGKTTTVDLVTSALEEKGFTIRGFHHRVKGSKIKSNGGAIASSTRDTLWKRALRRIVPKSLRGIRTGLKDARHYSRVLSAEIKSVQDRGAVVLLDRYIYDQLVDVRIWSRPWYQSWPIALACRRMARPALTFILDDDPEKIFERKPEMSVAQIEVYNKMMVHFLDQLQLPHETVDLRGRDSIRVSQLVADTIAAYLKTHGRRATSS